MQNRSTLQLIYHRIHRWLRMALLNNAFSGQSDTALTYTRRAVAEHAQANDFPHEAINAEQRRSGLG